MEINRRSLLFFLAALPTSGPLKPVVAGRRPLYLTSSTSRDQQHGATIIDDRGDIVARFNLPGRGHGAAIDSRGRYAVLFARRPGKFAVIVDVRSRRVVHLIESAPDRHFYGHGSFSSDGRWLFATENDYENERGVLGIYDSNSDYQRVGEIPSHGIGPHEAVLMPDGETLAVANGGILTHPSAPRVKLNLDDMRPSLALIRLRDSELISKLQAPADFHQLSIRHLAVNQHGVIAIATQWEGPQFETPPLIGLWSREDELRLLAAPAPVQNSMRNYCGSVTFCGDGSRFLVSSPRGNTLTEWAIDGTFLRSAVLRDGCAVAPASNQGYIATSGTGRIVSVPFGIATPIGLSTHDNLSWDNHMLDL